MRLQPIVIGEKIVEFQAEEIDITEQERRVAAGEHGYTIGMTKIEPIRIMDCFKDASSDTQSLDPQCYASMTNSANNLWCPVLKQILMLLPIIVSLIHTVIVDQARKVASLYATKNISGTNSCPVILMWPYGCDFFIFKIVRFLILWLFVNFPY